MKHARKNRPRPGKCNGSQTRKPKSDQVTDLLKICLQKVCELQQDLEKNEDFESDAQAAGYAACAMETLRFLSREGLAADHPIVKALSEKLTGEKDE